MAISSPEHRGREATLADVTQHSLAELDVAQVVPIGLERRFAKGSAVDVIEYLSRQFAASEFAIVLNRRRREVEAVVSWFLGHTSLCSTL